MACTQPISDCFLIWWSSGNADPGGGTDHLSPYGTFSFVGLYGLGPSKKAYDLGIAIDSKKGNCRKDFVEFC